MVKERIVEVVPEIVRVNKEGIQRQVRMIDDDMVRSKVTKVLRKYKLL